MPPNLPIVFQRSLHCAWMAVPIALLASYLALSPAHAAATADQITREALLRGYNTQDAERRYRELQNRQNTASTSAGNAMASGLGALAANMEKRMQASNERFDRFYALMEAGLDVPMQIQSDLDTVQTMFDQVVDTENYNMAVRRRLVEYALHLRQYSSRVFASPKPTRAAQVLRRNAYDRANFYPWSAHMLAKLYLTGNGVPRDEGEAFYLLSRCSQQPGNFVKSVSWIIPSDAISCRLTLAQALRFGWGTPMDAEKADRLETDAVNDYRRLSGNQLTTAELRKVLL